MLLLAWRDGMGHASTVSAELPAGSLGAVAAAMARWREARAALALAGPDRAQPGAGEALDALLAVTADRVLEPLLAALARAGWPPAAREAAEAPELAVCATGIAGQIPWHALPMPGEGLLGEAYAVSCAPGLAARAAAAVRAARCEAGRACALGVFDPAPHHGWPGLGLAATLERAAVESWFAEAAVLAGEAASKPAVLHAAHGRTHLHLACHGRFDAADPARAGLQLGAAEAAAGFWSAGEIAAAYPLLEGCRLVFANACETGEADWRHLPGEGEGLVTAFLRAGAAAVVANRWAVGDAAAHRFAAAFYAAHRGEGRSPVQAGRRALIALRRQGAGNAAAMRLAPPPGAAEPRAARPMSALAWAPFSVWGA